MSDTRPYLILSREGVLDDPSLPVPSVPEQWQPLPGSLEALARLCRQGRRLLLTSMQPGLLKTPGKLAELHALHMELRRRLRMMVLGGGVEAVFLCSCEAGARDCPCADPGIQLFPEIARRIERSDLAGISSLADLGSCVSAAQAVGAAPVHLLSGRGRDQLERGAVPTGVPVYRDLAAYVKGLAAP